MSKKTQYGTWDTLVDNHQECLEALSSLKEYPILVRRYNDHLTEEQRGQAQKMLQDIHTDAKRMFDELDGVAKRHKNRLGEWYRGKIHTESASMCALEIHGEYASLMDQIRHSLMQPFAMLLETCNIPVVSKPQ